jgi:hypothetical protein
MKQRAVLRDEQKDEPVDDPQELAIVVLPRQVPIPETISKRAVRWMNEETLTERLDRFLESLAQGVQCPDTLLSRFASPSF